MGPLKLPSSFASCSSPCTTSFPILIFAAIFSCIGATSSNLLLFCCGS